MAASSGLFLATIYNQLHLMERKHVARYWLINTVATAVPLSAHPSPLVITTKLAAAILVVAVVRRRGSAGPVLLLWCICIVVHCRLAACIQVLFHVAESRRSSSVYYCHVYNELGDGAGHHGSHCRSLLLRALS